MAKHVDISELKSAWKTLFTQWHLDGCKEGTWCISSDFFYKNKLIPSEMSLNDYFKTGYASNVYGFGGDTLFYYDKKIILAAECENELKIGCLMNTYKRKYSTRDFLSTFNIPGITATIEKAKHHDYLLITGTLASFEKSEFYDECKKIYDERLKKNQEWENFQKSTIAYALNNKERLIAIYNSPLLRSVSNFFENNYRSFWECNTYRVYKDILYAEEVIHPSVTEDRYYHFSFKKNGYQNLSDLDFPLFAVALILTRYTCNPAKMEDAELEKLLIQSCSFGKDKIEFKYYADKEETTAKLKGILE